MQNTQHLERSDEGQSEHPYNLHQAIERFEGKYIRNILELTRWNRAQTAFMLGVSQETLAAKIRQHHLSPAHDP